ncbi:MAG TPA: hypothetical protein VM427_06145 [Patescibacteria group bacterium]|nr:hypothetical protein [Patescibacteria group bacterium]
MTARPLGLILGAGLLILIGVSGMAAGGGLLGVALNGDSAAGVRQVGLAIGSVIAGYGFIVVLAGVGLLLLRRWAWRIGLATLLLGLVGLAGALAGTRTFDPILVLGLGFWGLALICLLLPSTNEALGR